MPAPYAARCACGSVTATVAGEPIGVRQCWCRQCQKAAAGGPTNNAMFHTADIVLDGVVSETSYVAASGNTLYHGFCAQCGTPISGRSSARPQFKALRLGFLEAGHGLSPQVAIWTSEAPEWAVIDPAIEHFDRQPPPPPVEPK